MLADVAGYSAMMERDEAGTHLRLREVRTQITDPAIERHYGRIVRSRGDDLLVEFASAVEALSCAVEIQRAMAEHNRGLAADSRIEFRIGVNLGDILIDGTDIAGDGVNVAARLEALAQPGEISISQAVREQVRQLVGVRLTDAGQHRVKNISRPIRVFKVNLDGAPGAHAARWMRWRRPVLAATALLAAAVALWAVTQHARISALLRDPAPPLSLAVLPVIDATGDPRGAQAARQLTGQLTAAMSHMAGGPVTAEAIAAASAARSADARAVGRELDVRYVATARLLALAPRHRLAAALVSADSGAQLWSSTIEAEVQAGDDVPIELVGRIADTLVSELRTAELKRASAADNDATTLTLRARAMLPSTDTVEGCTRRGSCSSRPCNPRQPTSARSAAWPRRSSTRPTARPTRRRPPSGSSAPTTSRCAPSRPRPAMPKPGACARSSCSSAGSCPRRWTPSNVHSSSIRTAAKRMRSMGWC